MIPRIIHRLWINPPGPPMPDEFVEYGVKWRELHPYWQVIDWESIDELRPLTNQRLYDDAPARDVHRYRADVARLELLYRFGGVYTDTDLEPLRPIDELLDGRTCVLAESANRGPGDVAVVSNSFMATTPNHPLILRAIETLPVSARRFAKHHTAISVGPWHLQRTLNDNAWHDVTVLPPWVFYPQSIAQRRRREPVNLSRAYGWHKWATQTGRT